MLRQEGRGRLPSRTKHTHPRPPSSAESTYSEHSRVRQRPSPLPLRSGSNHQKSHPGRLSPAVSTTSSGTERAAVQRLSGRPTTSVASSNHSSSKPRRSESFSSNRDKRPLTAGSTTSQVSTKIKGLIVRQGDSSSPRVRSSSETSRGTGDSSHDEKTGLDDLIRSEETIHYTLTPRSMREIEVRFHRTVVWVFSQLDSSGNFSFWGLGADLI